MQKARCHPDKSELQLMVSIRFQVLFHSPKGVLFTFPSRYFFTIGHYLYLALRDGPRGFNQDFSCPDLLGILASYKLYFNYRTVTFYGSSFRMNSSIKFIRLCKSHNPIILMV